MCVLWQAEEEGPVQINSVLHQALSDQLAGESSRRDSQPRCAGCGGLYCLALSDYCKALLLLMTEDTVWGFLELGVLVCVYRASYTPLASCTALGVMCCFALLFDLTFFFHH